jgi:Lecithin:cholesterol acyltransferase
MAKKAMSDVIVTIPGITGSVLRKNNRDVWNISGGAFLNALRTLGDSIEDLKLENDSPTDQDIGDGVTATSVIQDVHVLPGIWKIDGYTKLVGYIKDKFDVTEGDNFFEFPYDWRRDNRVHARRLAEQSEGWLADWKARSGAEDPRLVIVGHSMGGLIARYFLECLEGWKRTRTLVTFGTPYRGAPKALGVLANGVRKKVLFKTLDLSDLARSFTAIYQLLPSYPCYDPGTGLVDIADADIAGVDRQMATDAREFHLEIERAVETNKENPEYQASGYRISPVVGILQPTTQSGVLKDGKVVMYRTIAGQDYEGDGTVPRPSATPKDLGDKPSAMFSAEKHASLQNDDGVLTQLNGVLTQDNIDFDLFRAASGLIGLSLDVEDDYPVGEPITVRVKPESDPQGPILVRADEADTGVERARAVLKPGDEGWLQAELGPLEEGLYRVTAYGGESIDSVTDLVVVLQEPD